MDCMKVGALILKLRKGKGMTQKELADRLNISDKAVSKWERGLGCPDVSLLPELSEILGVNLKKILLGDLKENQMDSGNISRIKFYVCPVCGNIVTGTGKAEVYCCGRKLSPMEARMADEDHALTVEVIEDEFYITFHHEMEKSHYINFIAYVTTDRVFLVRLYPEQGNSVRIPRFFGGRFYYSCSQHGLWFQKLN